MFCDAWFGGNEVDEFVGPVHGLDGANADFLDRGGLEQIADQVGELVFAIEIASPATQIDATQNQLGESCADELFGFGEDTVGGKGTALSADVWDHAEGTAVVTSILNFKIGAGAVRKIGELRSLVEHRGSQYLAVREDIAYEQLWLIRGGTFNGFDWHKSCVGCTT